MREELLANMFYKTRKGGGGWVLSDRAKKNIELTDPV